MARHGWVDPARWSESELAEAKRRWVAGESSTDIRATLGMTDPYDLMRLALRLGWPSRGGKQAVYRSGPAPMEFTPEQVAEMRRLYVETTTPIRTIARQFGCKGHSTITRVAKREGWPLRGEDAPLPFEVDPAAQVVAERRALRQACPGCGYRVAPGGEAQFAEEAWWHKGCVPSGGDRAPTGPFRAKSAYRGVSTQSEAA